MKSSFLGHRPVAKPMYETAARTEDFSGQWCRVGKPCASPKPGRRSRKLHNVKLLAVRQVLRLGMVSSALYLLPQPDGERHVSVVNEFLFLCAVYGSAKPC